MNKKINIFFLVIIAFGVFIFSYNQNPSTEFDKVFITLATFLFSIFTGFFISNQNGRYGKIRDNVSQYDGRLSGIYRASMHFGEETQKKIGDIIVRNYEPIIKNNEWDYNFTHKSNTIIDIQNTLKDYCAEEPKFTEVSKQSMARVTSALLDIQSLRKQIVALREERIPKFQWVLVIIFATMLLITVSSLPSYHFIIGSLLKAAFAVSIISVLFILKSFDNLAFFEGRIGEHSAKDVMDIIKGEK
ncbi:DUF4239 domain-containing protein [Candidatus Nomurabacteria bacterium]|nr:DUF4239 domain-containing protein [Candidatus Nomurabacteria bacterium]MCB9820424.1 DUF4239 domain-containing protein [Candidatus Nomurabacteria bacterium]